MGYWAGSGLYGDKESQRDKRRTFTLTQQKEILYQQNNNCAICKNPLDPRDIEFDHIKPWADKGRTIAAKGAALCGSCHNKKTHADRLKKVDKSKR